MDRYRSYDGRRGSTRRRHSTSARTHNDRSSHRAVKLFICAGLFIAAALMKLLFPSTLAAIGDQINTVVNYKAALTALGEGISGEKKFTTALGEAFTYAFTGSPGDASNTDNAVQTSDEIESATGIQTSASTPAGDTAPENSDASLVNDKIVSDTSANEDAEAVFAEDKSPDTTADAAVTENKEVSLSDAIVAAFIESQEEYSDYAIPAGVTYEMPRISIEHASPLEGVVSSSFGYRIHPTEKVVKFHFGTDIVAKKGTPITAFADGKVLAAGESATLGKYVIMSHGGIESQYAHCSSITVTSGQTVKKGDKIATVGDTGNATETCLHFELKVSGQYVNPEYYVQWK